MSNASPTLNLGDIVRVDGKRGMGLVIRAEVIISEDRARGDYYSVEEFDIVKYDGKTTRGAFVNPKPASFYFNDGSMHGKGTKVEKAQVRVVGSAKVKTKVTVEYIFNSAKLA